MNKQPHLLVMAGGTGGHVFPGLAVAKKMADDGWLVTWLGTQERIEAQLVPEHGFPIAFLDVKGIRGNGIRRKLLLPWMLGRAVYQAMAVLKQIKPDVVLGMGGFASGPGGIAARLMGYPLVIHEQNATAGMTNRYLSKVANRTLQAFPSAFAGKGDYAVVGNPVRQDVQAAGEIPRHFAERLNVLVVGGSLGAAILNQQVPQALASLMDRPIRVRHQTGRNNTGETKVRYFSLGIEQAEIIEFIDDMAGAYAWADVVICRAGALTVSEVAAAGVPAIFVPYPHAVDDHQSKNAQYLVAAGAARLLPQAQLDAKSLRGLLLELVDPLVREQMAVKARNLATLDATEKVAKVCSGFLEREVK